MTLFADFSLKENLGMWIIFYDWKITFCFIEVAKFLIHFIFLLLCVT